MLNRTHVWEGRGARSKIQRFIWNWVRSNLKFTGSEFSFVVASSIWNNDDSKFKKCYKGLSVPPGGEKRLKMYVQWIQKQNRIGKTLGFGRCVNTTHFFNKQKTISFEFWSSAAAVLARGKTQRYFLATFLSNCSGKSLRCIAVTHLGLEVRHY